MDRPLRVAYLGHVARLSGGELALYRLIEALGESVEPHVVLAEDGPLVTRLRAIGVSVTILPLKEGVRDLRRDRVGSGLSRPRDVLEGMRYVGRTARVLRRIRPDIVHTNTLKAGVYGSLAARLARVPVIWHVRDRIASDYLPPGTVAVMRRLVRRLPDAVVTNSRATLETLHAPQDVRLLYNVIPEIAQETAPARVREDETFRVGIVGRIAAWKGHDVFLRAFALAFDQDRSVIATIVGEALFGGDDLGDELRALAGELDIADRVEFRGFREDVPAELERLDVLVHASTVPEPFGQVVLEGLAAGLPVVATREGGPAEIVEDGVTGLLYPAGDVQGLAEVLRRLRGDTDLRESLAAAGLRRAKDFSPEVVADLVLQMYNEVVQRAR